MVDADDIAHALSAPGRPATRRSSRPSGRRSSRPTARSTACGCASGRSPTLRSGRASRPAASADPRRDRAPRRRVARHPTACSSCRCCSSAAASLAGRARAGRRLPGGRAGAPGGAPQRPRPEGVRAIMATQLPRAERLARADDVIDNAGPPGRSPRGGSPRRPLPRRWPRNTRPDKRDSRTMMHSRRTMGTSTPRRFSSLPPEIDWLRQRFPVASPAESRSLAAMIRYEHPLNERIRTLMRLEDRSRARATSTSRARSRRNITQRCSRCSRSPTSPAAPTSRPTCCRNSSGRSSCCRRCAQSADRDARRSTRCSRTSTPSMRSCWASPASSARTCARTNG